MDVVPLLSAHAQQEHLWEFHGLSSVDREVASHEAQNRVVQAGLCIQFDVAVLDAWQLGQLFTNRLHSHKLFLLVSEHGHVRVEWCQVLTLGIKYRKVVIHKLLWYSLPVCHISLFNLITNENADVTKTHLIRQGKTELCATLNGSLPFVWRDGVSGYLTKYFDPSVDHRNLGSLC